MIIFPNRLRWGARLDYFGQCVKFFTKLLDLSVKVARIKYQRTSQLLPALKRGVELPACLQLASCVRSIESCYQRPVIAVPFRGVRKRISGNRTSHSVSWTVGRKEVALFLLGEQAIGVFCDAERI